MQVSFSFTAKLIAKADLESATGLVITNQA